MLFQYDAGDDTWKAYSCYFENDWYSSSEDLPPESILTRNQAKEIADCNTNFLPDSGVIYDGTVYPGTRFSITCVADSWVSDIANQTYTGSAITPAPRVVWNDRTLVKGIDYTVAYANNTNVGTATVTITGKGNFAGTVTKKFKIIPKSLKSGWVAIIPNQS